MLFDTHAHYWDDRFISEEGNCDALLEDVLGNGVCGIVNVGTDLDTSRRALEQSCRHQGMFTAAGIHPSDCPRYAADPAAAIASLERLIVENRKNIVALGECGLDYYWPGFDKEMQKQFFSLQLELGAKLDIPVIVHDRDAHGDTLAAILAHPQTRGVLHSYSGSTEMAMELIAHGWYISFSGSVTFKNAARLATVPIYLPQDKVMIETDAPYLTPHPFRGKRNDSSYLRYTADKIAELWGVSYDEVCAITTANAQRFFGLMS